MTYTKHAQWDRMDRMTYIQETVGFGEVIAEHLSRESTTCYRQLTNTGVILITDKAQNVLVTAYIANVGQAVSTYCKATHQDKIPPELFQIVLRNRPFRAEQP